MTDYKIEWSSGRWNVMRGSHVTTFYYGSPFVEWTIVGTFHTIQEATSCIEFMRKGSGGNYHLYRDKI